MVLAPGQASLYHGWTLHGSGPNSSGDRRIGLTFQFLAPSMRQLLDARESATLVRGTDAYGHCRPEPVSASDFDAKMMAVRTVAERRRHAVYDLT